MTNPAKTKTPSTAIKIIFIGLLCWGTVILARGGYIGLLDNVDLIFHEAGHTIFHFFGDFVRILGGSLMQALIPIICGVVFFFKKQWFAIGFALWWLGQNLVNVSIYIGDATAQQLELLGGEAVIHDWNYLLGMLGKRHLDTIIAHNGTRITSQADPCTTYSSLRLPTQAKTPMQRWPVSPVGFKRLLGPLLRVLPMP